MDIIVIGLGVAIILIVLRDMFHTLGHPLGQGSLSRLVMKTLWRLSHCGGGHGRLAKLVGPFGLLTVMMMWGALAVGGWALVYWPFIPAGFVFSANPLAGSAGNVLDALYLSLVTISTLGFGDVVPDLAWLRVVVPLEAIFGFALLTAAVSWILQVYPALTRRRALAIHLALLSRSDASGVLQKEGTAAALLQDITGSMIAVRVDLSQYSETYYFRDEPDFSLAATLGFALELARIGETSVRADVRFAATILDDALIDLAGVLDTRFLHSGGTASKVFDAYAVDHGQSFR